jgi:predicted transcriptional regulator
LLRKSKRDFKESGLGWRRRPDVRKTEIRVEGVDSFFERGRKHAKAADRGDAIPSSRLIAFEDAESLLHVLTEKRLLVLKQVKETPTSIAALAKKLRRQCLAMSRSWSAVA